MTTESKEKEKSESIPVLQLTTEDVHCNLCGTKQATRLFTEKYELLGSQAELGINRCEQCSLVYVSPRLDQQSTSLVYHYDAEHTISHNYCWDGSTSNSRFEPLLNRLQQFSHPGRLLDVGCGSGHFLRAARETGRWQVEGVEPNTTAAEQAREYAECEVQSCFLEEAYFSNRKFSVVSLLGVLEHLHNPTSLLRHVHSMLETDGLIAAYVPNFTYLRIKDAGFLSRIRFGTPSHLCPQEHLFQYTENTLGAILRNTGFEVLQTDIGRPFVHGGRIKRSVKECAFQSVKILRQLTGLHFGGLEVIARRNSN